MNISVSLDGLSTLGFAHVRLPSVVFESPSMTIYTPCIAYRHFASSLQDVHRTLDTDLPFYIRMKAQKK
jgi:hypothetical protein